MKAFKYLGRRIPGIVLAAGLAMACGVGAQAVEVGGVKVDEVARVANQDLKLNGAGIRYWAVFKVYVASLYLPEKKKTVADILASNGPRRMQLALLRDVNSEELGQAFVDGLNANTEKTEKSKFVNQTVKMGEIFASLQKLGKGDVITCDWVPSAGMKIYVNGKQLGETLPDLAFYNAFLRIWLGDKPAGAELKTALIGG